MPRFLEVVAPPISVNDTEDTYNEFEAIYTPDVLESISQIAFHAVRQIAPDIQAKHIWASGFSGGYSAPELAAIDTAKRNRTSSTLDERSVDEEWIGFEGDDSNEVNVTERAVHILREQKQLITKRLSSLHEQGLLTPTEQTQARDELTALNTQIDDLRKVSNAKDNLPIYYATPVSGLLDTLPEDNPLSYIGDVPGMGHVALYDGRSMASDPDLRVSEKTDRQLRIAGLGLHVMRHALAVVRLEFVE